MGLTRMQGKTRERIMPFEAMLVSLLIGTPEYERQRTLNRIAPNLDELSQRAKEVIGDISGISLQLERIK